MKYSNKVDMGTLCECGAPLREHRGTAAQCPPLNDFGQTFRPADKGIAQKEGQARA